MRQEGEKYYNLRIDIKELKKEIDDLLFSNILEDSKTGLHNLLGEILDQAILLLPPRGGGK